MEPNEILRPTETETVNALLVEVGESDERDFGVEVWADPAAVQVPVLRWALKLYVLLPAISASSQLKAGFPERNQPLIFFKYKKQIIYQNIINVVVAQKRFFFFKTYWLDFDEFWRHICKIIRETACICAVSAPGPSSVESRT